MPVSVAALETLEVTFAGRGRGWFVVALAHPTRRDSARTIAGPFTTRGAARGRRRELLDPIEPGRVFCTPFERDCVVVTSPDADENFLALDSNGVECELSIAVVTL